MKLQSSLDVLLLCNGKSLMKSIVCSQLKWKNFLCHLCMLSILILCILQFKTNKKNVNKKTWMTQDYLAAFHACWLQYHTRLWYIYIYISNLDIWCLIDVFAFLQWPRWEQAGVHQRHPALPVWGGHAFSPGKRSLGPPRSLSEDLHMFSQSSDFDL